MLWGCQVWMWPFTEACNCTFLHKNSSNSSTLKVIQCIFRFAFTLYTLNAFSSVSRWHLFFFLSSILQPELSVMSLHHVLISQTLPHQSLHHHPAAKDEVTPDRRARCAAATRTEPPSPLPCIDEREKSPPACKRPRLRLPVRLTGQMLLWEAGHSWLDPSCYASILLLPQAAVTAPTFPTRRRDQ